MLNLEIIGFDADDTLWHNERHYTEAKEKFQKILEQYHTSDWIEARLDETELQNLNRYGYGIKSFALSMIETGIQLTEGRISANEIHEIIRLAWKMLEMPMQIFPGVQETIASLSEVFKILLITKGDLFEQEAKIVRSGLGDYFHGIEIVSEKTPSAYASIIDRHQCQPQNFLMIGNSVKSDILPVLAIGGHAIHIPFETTWVHEMVSNKELSGKNFFRLEQISEVPTFLNSMIGEVK